MTAKIIGEIKPPDYKDPVKMLRNLADNTPWISKPELVEIVAANVALTPRDQRRVASFNLRFRLMRTSEAQKAADAASAAGGGK